MKVEKSIPRRLQRVARRAFILPVVSISLFASSAFAEGGYTNHAGNVVAGWPVKLTQREVTLAEGVATNDCRLATNGCGLAAFQPSSLAAAQTNAYPLSIFPASEQRRIAADFVLGQGGGQVGLLRVPDAVRRAVAGAEKAMARSRRRAAKGLCTQEESDAFCAKTEAALGNYLDRQVKEGVITPVERRAIGH